MPEVVRDLARLPAGSHCLEVHVSRDEAEDHAVRFLAGNPSGWAASFWVPSAEEAMSYDRRLAEIAPQQVGCVHALPNGQVLPVDGHLRPAHEVAEFVGRHTEGLTGGADTLSERLTAENLPDHVEYERWFQDQPRARSRFLCPYDLRRIPPSEATEFLRALGAHHSHVALSGSNEPAVRLLQLFLFPTRADLPESLADTLRWAVEHHLLEDGPRTDPLRLTPSGQQIVDEWSRTTTVDW